jgi:ribonuclease HI
MCGHQNEVPDSLWKKIWRLKVPERVRFLMWMVIHNRLLTDSLKSKMGLRHAMCEFCGDQEETTLHVMRDCPKAMNIWNYVVPVAARGTFFMGDLQHWVDLNLNNNIQWRESNGAWSEFWALSCHCLWTWRNKECHDDDFVRPYQPVSFIAQLSREYKNAASNNHVVTARNQSVVLIGWSPPKPQFVKLNTNGAYKVSQVAGCGGVIRGCQGEWLGGFAKCVGLCSAFIAELWGVVEGLRLAHRLGFKKVELNIDSEAVVHVVNNGISSSVMGYSLLQRIRNLLSMDWTVEMKHTYREANKCAHGMTNLGCTLRYDVIYFNSCPAQISELCHADMVGNSTPRLISL